jgi:hypothetical protein
MATGNDKYVEGTQLSVDSVRSSAPRSPKPS